MRTIGMTNGGNRRRDAFTLVELLVVVAIVSLLVSLLLPALASARESAAATQCAGNMRQIGIGIFAYATDNNTKFPFGTLRPGVGPFSVSIPAQTYDTLIDVYIGGRGIVAGDATTYQNLNPVPLPVLVCPRDPFRGNSSWAARTYSMNGTISGGDNLYAGTTSASVSYPAPASMKSDAVPDPAGTFLLVEAPNNTGTGRGRQGASVAPQSGPHFQSSRIAGALISGTVYIAPGQTLVTTHPYDKFNYLYCDGHVAQKYPLDTDTRNGVLTSTKGCRFSVTFGGDAWCWPGANSIVAPKPWDIK